MKITTLLGEVFIVPRLIWPELNVQSKDGVLRPHLATDGAGKWFGPTEIVEITDHPTVSDLQEIVKRVDGERDAAKAELEMVQRNIAVLRVENDALKQRIVILEGCNELYREENAKLSKNPPAKPFTQQFEITIKPV